MSETHYFIGDGGTAYTIIGDGATYTIPGAMTETDLASYEVYAAAQDAARQVFNDQANLAYFRANTVLLVARSPERVNAGTLDNEVLDIGKAYAVFVPDTEPLGITQVVYSIDAVAHHTEFSAPWDYDGTAFGGEANRVTFVAGQHTIDAEITDAQGVFVVSATFEVE